MHITFHCVRLVARWDTGYSEKEREREMINMKNRYLDHEEKIVEGGEDTTFLSTTFVVQ